MKTGGSTMRAVTKALMTGLLAVTAAAGLTVPAVAATPAAGFGYGTDSWPMTVTGSGPYTEPVLGSAYTGYMGMAGNWARYEGCKTGNMYAFSPGNAGRANKNYRTYHVGVGTGEYWYMGGPGVDPHYNGTTAESYHWGEEQASLTLQAVKGKYVPYPVIWADIEMPEIAPAPDNGWNSVYTSPCSGKVKSAYVAAAVDRAEFNGYAAYLTGHSGFKVGVYSSAPIWSAIFGTGQDGSIPDTYEWTYLPATTHVSAAPSGWCLTGSSTCAQFFGGQTSSSKYALMWQWSGGGGYSNGYGDFDQIDTARMK